MNAKIKEVNYIRFENARTTICQITLKNGFEVVGTSCCDDMTEFDINLEKKYAYDNAIEKISEYEAYYLKENEFTNSRLRGMTEGFVYIDEQENWHTMENCGISLSPVEIS